MGKRSKRMSLRRFLRDARAGATSFAAAGVSMMALGGAALIVDHVWLVDHRDLLKTAADSAAVAATLELGKLANEPDDDVVHARVKSVAERYVRLNVMGNLPPSERRQAQETLEVTLPDFDRSSGMVQVEASADLGGVLLAKLLFDYEGPEKFEQRAAVEAAITPTELVLAIDVTGSMGQDLAGQRKPGGHRDSRMEIVKRAALDLVDILASRTSGGAAPVAVGLVPWHWRVQLGPDQRDGWEREGWAVYPDERTYPNPYDGRRPNPSGAPAVTVSLPEKPGEWRGCLDQRSTEGDDPPAFSSTLPSDAPFSMNFYTSHTFYPEDYDVSFACAWDGPGDHRRWNWCYDQSAVPESARSDPSWDLKDPQQACDGENPSVIRPLDSDLESVKSAIRALGPGGPATYSTLGVAWATRLLDPAWRDLWGDAVHPMESTDGGQAVQKILVLLSDGDDNHHDRDVTDRHRQQACTAAKAAGIRIFTIAAMNESHRDHGHLARELERCSSQADDPGGAYVFVNNATPEDLEEAFRDIGGQLLVMRRVY